MTPPLTFSNPLRCPVCKGALKPTSAFLSCQNAHHFDKSKSGYTNLLLANQKRSLQPGDSKEMVRARLDFLSQNYYQPIAQALSECVDTLAPLSSSPCKIVDNGCGVGYYTHFLKQNCHQTLELWGVDISKEAIKTAATAYPNAAQWLVSSMKELPFLNTSVNCVVSVFAPLQKSEIVRILSPQGILLTVTPARQHLIEYRQQLFNEIKEIDAFKIENTLSEDFFLDQSLPINTTIQLKENDQENLLKMTPYYWKSTPQQQANLHSFCPLQVTIDVTVRVFRKKF